MKKFLVLLLLVVLAQTTSAHVLISEVIANPINTESGGEAVELYNPNDYEMNISGYVIATSNSEADATIPENTFMPAYSFYLVADIGWSEEKDNMSWPDADHEETLTLKNTDSGVALKLGDDIIDAAGWGNASEPLFEGEPLANPQQGQSFERKPGMLWPENGNHVDTDDNTDDFLVREVPEPQNSLSPVEGTISSGNNTITLHVLVYDSLPAVVSFVIPDDDPTVPGVQVNPNPGGIREVEVDALIDKKNPYINITEVSITVKDVTLVLTNHDLNNTYSLYKGSFTMKYYDEPGDYPVEIKVVNSNSAVVTDNAVFTYMGLTAMEVDISSLLSSVVPGSSVQIIGDQNMSTDNSTTVRNIGNVPMDIQIRGNDLVSGENVIEISSIDYTFFENDFSNMLAGSLSNSFQTEPINLGFGPYMTNELSFRINIPLDAAQGSYSGDVSIIAVASGK